MSTVSLALSAGIIRVYCLQCTVGFDPAQKEVLEGGDGMEE